MKAGRIREDFFYRLCGDQVNTVALHEILTAAPDEINGSVHYICRKLFGPEGGEELAPRVVQTLRTQVPQDYEWPGNFRELEQAVRNVVVRNEYVPMVRGNDSCKIEALYENTEVSLAQWSATYARKAYENAGSYREAARRLEVDQRTLKKLVGS